MATGYIIGPFRLDADAALLFRGSAPIALGQRAIAVARGEEPGGERWIETMPKYGYRFVGPVPPDDQASVAAPPSAPTEALRLPVQPAVAVLPFQNMSGDPEQESFADGD